jgi:hypothetical protein
MAAVSSRQNAGGINIENIGAYADENPALITYEIRSQQDVFAIRETRNVTIIGTNNAYADVMGYPPVCGGFFSRSAFDAGAREAVLNELSAESLFGGVNISGAALRIDGELWTVAGVIVDDCESENIYVPASSDLISGGSQEASPGDTTVPNTASGALAVLMKNYGAADASGAINVFNDLGAGENSFSYINIGKAAGAIGEMSGVAISFALALSLLLFALQSARAATRAFRSAENPRSHGVFKTIVFAILFLVFATAALGLSKQIAEICVAWREIPPVFLMAESGYGGFDGRLGALGGYQTKTFIFFASSAAASIAAAVAAARACGD